MYKTSSKKFVADKKTQLKHDVCKKQLEIDKGALHISQLSIGDVVLGQVFNCESDSYIIKVVDGHGVLPHKEIPVNTSLRVGQAIRVRVIGFLADSSRGVMAKLRMRRVKQF